jgi:Domain of unknown function (DUF4124)
MRSNFWLFALLLATWPAGAVYKCVVDGKTTFSDTPCATNAEQIQPRGSSRPSVSTELDRSFEDLRKRLEEDRKPGGLLNPLDMPFTPLSIDNIDAIRRTFEELKPRIVYNLKDPSSAIFRHVRAVRVEYAGEKKTCYCGQINAKNSYGGYGGYEPFFVDNEKVEIGEEHINTDKEIGDKWYKFGYVIKYCFLQGELVAQ